jgi:hypothetical protein
MRKLLFSCLVLMTLNVFGQDGFIPPPRPTYIVTLQMGTDTIKNGLDTVSLSEDALSEMNEVMADTNFTVTLTPRGDCGQLNLMKTNSRYFIVKQQGGVSPKALFDYVLFCKQNRPLRPGRPPMLPGHPVPPQH